MYNLEKRTDERSCNCKNSKCSKLYCECFAARMSCTKNCRCLDCQNTEEKQLFRQNSMAEKLARQDFFNLYQGCSCKRSHCMKRYCQCFQSGNRCGQYCKCIDCQNNDTILNRKVIDELRKQGNELIHTNKNVNLYPLNLSQNSEHFNSMICESNPFKLEENWLQNCANILCQSAQQGNPSTVMNKLIQILSELEQNINEQNSLKQPIKIKQFQIDSLKRGIKQYLMFSGGPTISTQQSLKKVLKLHQIGKYQNDKQENLNGQDIQKSDKDQDKQKEHKQG